MNTSLELVRMVIEDDMPNEEKLRLAQTYRKHFDDTIHQTNRDKEILAEYLFSYNNHL